MKYSAIILMLLALIVIKLPGDAQVWKSARWERVLKDKYDADLDIVYSEIGGIQNKLDLYVPKNGSSQNPTLIWFHGGGWSHNSKDQVSGQLIPFLESGWVVANVDYRLDSKGLAPAAVVDCRCALFWVIAHANERKIDVKKIVLAGTSAGAHLALITGMLPSGNSLDKECVVSESAGVAAILDFYGPTYLDEAFEGSTRNGSVAKWIGNREDKREIAHLVSPMSYVRTGLPPVFIVHGDSDPNVPYDQSVKLQKALDAVGVRNEFHTVAGGKHGGFSKEENLKILNQINQFLTNQGIVSSGGRALDMNNYSNSR